LPIIERLIKNSSKKGDLILDPFSGSGTTAIACVRLKRNFICIEKNETFYKKSIERLEEERKQMILL
jgi:site-specific DNA-methyltransferase (adenine-specific)